MSQLELLKVTDDDESMAREFYVKYKQVPAAPCAPVLKVTKHHCPPRGICCPLWCYQRNYVIAAVVLTAVSSVIALSVFIDFGVTVLHPHVHVVNFVHGTCTVESGNYTSYPSKCGCQQGGNTCLQLSYPCLEVIVHYKTNSGEPHHTVLYASNDEFTYTSHCSITPHCVSGTDNRAEVEAFRLKYGQQGQKVSCFHDPVGYGAVITRLRAPMKIIHFLLWPGIATTLSFGSCLFVFCHCVPKFCNKEF